MPQCQRCREFRDCNEFFPAKTTVRGVQAYCKRCTRLYQNARCKAVRREAWQPHLSLKTRGANFTTPKAARSATVKDIAWAAGFLEGEGSFVAKHGKSQVVAAVQVQLEPLLRLQEIFGGAITARQPAVGLGKQPLNYWRACGARARGVMMTVFSLMSPRRKGQILTSLTEYAGGN